MKFNKETRGILQLKTEVYGESYLKNPLRYIPCKSKCELLVIAAIHGEESETTFLLSRVLRAFNENFKRIAFILCANPDGLTLGTRGNFRGVDLNRNFNTSNWESQKILSRSILESLPDTELSPGLYAQSEIETFSLVSLIKKLNPASIISMHSPMGCIDSPFESRLVNRLKSVFNLPHVVDIGYKTTGSLGTWCTENKIECITLELPRLPLELLFERYGRLFANFLENEDKV